MVPVVAQAVITTMVEHVAAELALLGKVTQAALWDPLTIVVAVAVLEVLVLVETTDLTVETDYLSLSSDRTFIGVGVVVALATQVVAEMAA